MIAVAHGIYGETRAKCGAACRRDPALRAEWGCEAKAERALARVTCAACEGYGCDECGKSGEVMLYRCPTSHNTAEIALAFEALAWSEKGVLPVPGGLLDQSAAFVSFARLVWSERGKIERARRASEEARRG